MEAEAAAGQVVALREIATDGNDAEPGTRPEREATRHQLLDAAASSLRARIWQTLLECDDPYGAAVRVAALIAAEHDFQQALFWTEDDFRGLDGRVVWPTARPHGDFIAARAGRILVQETWQHPVCRWVQHLEAPHEGWGTQVCFPVLAEGGVFGVVELRALQSRPRNDLLMSVLGEVGVGLGIVVRKFGDLEALRRRAEQHAAMLRAFPEILLRVDERGTVVDHRGALDHQEVADCRGLPIEEAWPGLPRGFRVAIEQAIEAGLRTRHEYSISAPGLRRDYEAAVVPMEDRTALAIIRDVSERALRERGLLVRAEELEAELAARSEAVERLEEELRHRAHVDPLTGLLNRRQLFERLPGEAARTERTLRQYRDLEDRPRNGHIGFVLVDLDHFEAVNDTYGHDAGDAVLVQLVGRLRLNTRASDTLYRWGGEEFLIVAHDTEPRELDSLAERVRSAVCDSPFVMPGPPLHLTCSIGYAAHPMFLEAGNDFGWQDTLAVADLALRAAKVGGRNRHVGVLPTARALPPEQLAVIRRDPLAAALSGVVEIVEGCDPGEGH